MTPRSRRPGVSILGLSLVLGILGACSSASEEATSPPAATEAGEPAVAGDDGLSQAIETANVPCSTLPPWSGGVDVLIWIVNTATADEIAQIDAELAASPVVEAVTFFDQSETFAEFQDFSGDTPILGVDMDVADMPTRFAVRVTDPADDNSRAIVQAFDPRLVVESVTAMPELCANPNFDAGTVCAELGLPSPATVFLDPSASQASIDRVGQALGEVDTFDSLTFTSQEEASAGFSEALDPIGLDETFQEQLVQDTDASDLPASYTLDVVPGTEQEALIDELRRDREVFAVLYLPGGCVRNDN